MTHSMESGVSPRSEQERASSTQNAIVAAPTPVCRSAAGSLRFGAAAAGLKGRRLLLVRHGATCTRFTPPSAASSSLAPRRVFAAARKGEARADQQTGDTKAGQNLLKLLYVHLRTPFQLIVGLCSALNWKHTPVPPSC